MSRIVICIAAGLLLYALGTETKTIFGEFWISSTGYLSLAWIAGCTWVFWPSH